MARRGGAVLMRFPYVIREITDDFEEIITVQGSKWLLYILNAFVSLFCSGILFFFVWGVFEFYFAWRLGLSFFIILEYLHWDDAVPDVTIYPQ